MIMWYFKRLFDAIRRRQFKPIDGAVNTEIYLSSLGDNEACIYVEVFQLVSYYARLTLAMPRCRLLGTKDRMNVLATQSSTFTI